jgi:hypothetical protein
MSGRRFSTRWIPLREAHRFVALHHRHHDPAQGGIVALGLWEGDRLVGVGIIGRPVSRELQRQRVAECIRSCILDDIPRSGDHASGAASFLTARLRLLGQALGFLRLVTYTLPHESGASLRADHWTRDLELVGGGEATRPSRPRAQANFPTERKVRWWAPLKEQKEIAL